MKTKTRKPLVALTLLAAIALTGCAGDKLTPENAPTPSVATQAAKTASPSATLIEQPEGEPLASIDPTAVPTADPSREMSEADQFMREDKNTPKSIDLDHIIENRTDDAVFESLPNADIKSGLAHGLGVYHDLVTMRNFYMERDASKDFSLVNNDLFADRIDRDLMTEMEEETAKHGHFTHITVTSGDKPSGVLEDGTELFASATPSYTFNDPDVDVVSDDRGTYVVINGKYDTHWEWAEGVRGTGKTEYWIGVMPSGDDSDTWTVVGLWKEYSAPKDLTQNGKPVQLGGGK